MIQKLLSVSTLLLLSYGAHASSVLVGYDCDVLDTINDDAMQKISLKFIPHSGSVDDFVLSRKGNVTARIAFDTDGRLTIQLKANRSISSTSGYFSPDRQYDLFANLVVGTANDGVNKVDVELTCSGVFE